MNIYQELELDPIERNPQRIIEAAEDKIKEWNKRSNNPKYKALVPGKIKNFKEIRELVTADTAIILQHAAEYAEIVRLERIKQEKDIRDAASIYVSNGEIQRVHLDRLVKENKSYTEAEILKLLGVSIKRLKSFTYKDDGIVALETATMSNIAIHLATVDKRDLYDFLGVSRTSSDRDIEEQRARKYKEATSNSNKTPEVTASQLLCGICKDLLLNPDKRKSYNKSVDNSAFENVRLKIISLSSGSSYITPEQYKALIEKCAENGVAFNKAEYLIYKTAEEKGLSIIEANDRNTYVQCRFCSALNADEAKTCKSCGMPLVIVCPKCRKTSSDHQELKCTKCGFSIGDMPNAEVKIKGAEVALSRYNVVEAEKNIRIAESIWSEHPKLGELKSRMAKVADEIKAKVDKILKLCGSKLYYTALPLLDSIGSDSSVIAIRNEVETAVESAKALLGKVAETTDMNRKLDLYMQVLSICADCEKAKKEIQLNPPMAPQQISATVRGKTISLSWVKLPSNYITYLIVRKADGRPAHLGDGESMGETHEHTYDDISAVPGRSYYYAVYGKCGEIVSKSGAVSNPILTVTDVDAKKISYDIKEKSIGFNCQFPANAKQVEVYRDGVLVKTLSGASFIDNDLVPDRQYVYKFVAVFEDCMGKKFKAQGVVLSLKPMSPPQPVKLMLSETASTATLRWNRPNKGVLDIYISDKPFHFHENDIVNFDTFKSSRLNIIGDSCVVNKDFNGERYYIPITVQGNIGVAGEQVRIVSLTKPSGVRFDQNDTFFLVSWKWEQVNAVRIRALVEGRNPLIYDVEMEISALPQLKVPIPKNVKSIHLAISSIVKSYDGKILQSEETSQLFNLETVKVDFVDVRSESIFKFLGKDKYSILVQSDTPIPCDLYLLIAENFPPNDLVNFQSYLTISPCELVPGKVLKKEFSYVRQQKDKAVHFRLITAERKFSGQVTIIPETRLIR